MNLSNEDNLRLNVLLHQDLHAIRIDESKMIVYGLSDKGEARIDLKPNCKDETYIKQVKELISTHVLGSPGGYPIFLRRWTRMGQSRTNESLERLLLLGESEAIVAVVNADEVNNEIARRAWWAMPTSANARCLLRHDDVIQGSMGKELADFLVEFLPFEEDPRAMLESTHLVLQKDLITDEVRDSLWKKGQRKNTLLVGFLKSVPDKLPIKSKPHPEYKTLSEKLESLKENPYAQVLIKVLSDKGQAYLQTVETCLKKPSNQDVVTFLLDTVKDYFACIRPNDVEYQDIDILLEDATSYSEVSATQNDFIRELIEEIPGISKYLKAIFTLSLIGEPLVRPVFARTDAIGTVMRKKLAHIIEPVQKEISVLKGKA